MFPSGVTVWAKARFHRPTVETLANSAIFYGTRFPYSYPFSIGVGFYAGAWWLGFRTKHMGAFQDLSFGTAFCAVNDALFGRVFRPAYSTPKIRAALHRTGSRAAITLSLFVAFGYFWVLLSRLFAHCGFVPFTLSWRLFKPIFDNQKTNRMSHDTVTRPSVATPTMP